MAVPPEYHARYHVCQFTVRVFPCYQSVATTDHHIVHIAALEMISRASGLVTCIAPTGYGKSVLALQASEHTTSYNEVRHLESSAQHTVATILAELAQQPRSLLVVDDVTTETLELLDQTTIGADHTVLCLSRSIDHRLARMPETTSIGEPHLRFGLAQIQQLAQAKTGSPLDGTTAQLLAANGWPQHVDLVVSTISKSNAAPEVAQALVNDGAHLEGLLNRCFERFSDEELEGLTQLAHLDQFSPAAADALVPGLTTSARSAGFPFLSRERNSLEMPSLIRARLRLDSTFSEHSADLLAPILVATLGTPATLKSLLSLGATRQAAEIVCSVSQDQLSATDQTVMLGILRAIEAAEPDQPTITLRRAGVHRNLAQLDAEYEAIQKAISCAKNLDLRAEALDAEVALLRIDLRRVDPDEAAARLDALETASAHLPHSRSTAAAIRELKTMVMAQKSDLPSIYRSIELFEELASEWEFMGDRLRSAWLMRMLAAGPLNHIGKYVQGRELMDRAMPLVKDNALGMAATAELLCRFLAITGEADRLPSQLAESRRLIGEVGLTWMAGYLDWAVMLSCIYSRDADEAERAFRRAASKLGELASGDTGTVFYAEAATVFAVLGKEQLAEECLSNAKKRTGNWIETAIAEATFHARCGNASMAEQLVTTLLRSPSLPNERSWRVELESVVAADRLGTPNPNRERTLERISEAARDLGLTALFEAVQAGVVPSEQPAAPATSQDVVHISLLGDFEVKARNEVLAVPPGHVTQLLKLLAARGEPLSVEFVVGRLWPDADLPVGKRRLKNVTSRLKALTDIPIVRRRGDRIFLSQEVSSDLALFREAASTAVRPPDTGTRLSACVEALNLYRGHLLPTDLYDDDLTRERDALRAVALSVLDVAIRYAEQRTVEPAWVLQVAITIGPDSEAPFLRIARIADATGAHECAAAANSQAESLVANLGMN